MTTLNTIIISIIQGVTEILPISSTGHIILGGHVLGLHTDLEYISLLHIGTTLAISIFYYKDITEIFKDKRSIFRILIAIIPAGVFGLLFSHYIHDFFSTPLAISITLIFWGIVMIITENFYKGTNLTNYKELPLKKILIIGIAQILAFIPGTSRSGITTLSGIYCGLEKYSALKFSFLIGIPLLLSGSIYETINSQIGKSDIPNIIFTILTSFVFSYLSILLVSRLSKRKWFTFFGIYRVILGILILAILL